MVFGITGSHRAGKSTLARKLSEALGIQFYETKTGEVLKAHGINPVANMPLNERMHAQEILLKHHVETLRELPRPLITDRTPLDMLAYTLGEISMHALQGHDPALDARFDAYQEACLEATRLHYQAVILVKPLTFYIDEDGKPPASRGYQFHIHTLLCGAIMRANIDYAVLRVDDLDHRMTAASGYIVESLHEMKIARDEAVKNSLMH